MKKYISKCVLAAFLMCSGTGCIFPTRSVMPATSIDCTVIDADLQQPIVYALLYMVYEGPNGDKVMEGPFLTDENGHGRIDVKKRSIWMKGTDAFFAGGYLRHIEVKVTGYKDSGYWENFNFCLLEKKAPFTFKLKHE